MNTPVVTITYPDSSVVTRTFTSRGLLASIDRGMTTLLERGYDDGGRLSEQTFGNNVVEEFTYWDDNQVKSIDGPAGLLAYAYDANKNGTSEAITGALAAASWTTGGGGFDEDDRLVARSQGSGPLHTKS